MKRGALALVAVALPVLAVCGGEQEPSTPVGASDPTPRPRPRQGSPSAVMDAFRVTEWQRRYAERFTVVDGAFGGRQRPLPVPGHTGVFKDFHLEGSIPDAEVPGLLAAAREDVAELLRDSGAVPRGGFRPAAEVDPALAGALFRMPGEGPDAGFVIGYRCDGARGRAYVLAVRLREDRWQLAVAVREDG